MIKDFFKKNYFLLVLGFAFFFSANFFNTRLDFTLDQRFTLKEQSIDYLKKIDKPLKLDVLMGGKIPVKYNTLRNELRNILKNMKKENNNFYYEFIDPFEEVEDFQQLTNELTQLGLYPEIETDNDTQSLSKIIFFPWIVMSYNNQSVQIPILINNKGYTTEDRILNSIKELEFEIINGIHKLTSKQEKNIAVITSHNTSEANSITDFVNSLKKYYGIASFDLKAHPENPELTLSNLKRFDLAIISNPKEKFTNTEKFILDQYFVSGGHSLWMVNPIEVAQDSLFSERGKTVGFKRNLELDDLFFKYSLRLNAELVTDLICAPIVLANQNSTQSNYLPYRWKFYPLAKPNKNYIIGKSSQNILFQFASSIDTLKNASISKKIIIASSNYSNELNTPVLISLEEALTPFKPSEFTKQYIPLGVLAEGTFTSLYKNRIHPFEISKFNPEGSSKMVVFGDGSLAENQTYKGEILELGYDKWTNNFYDNKKFLLNNIHYLLNNTDLLYLQDKTIRIPVLDNLKVENESEQWKYFAFITPLIPPLLIALGMGYFRKRNNRLKD